MAARAVLNKGLRALEALEMTPEVQIPLAPSRQCTPFGKVPAR